MTASEFAFLALGLVLGVASGAALVVVLGSKPRPREVRLTVEEGAVPRRASTLSSDAFTLHGEPARGGPADRRRIDRDDPVEDLPAAAASPGPRSPGIPVMGPAAASTGSGRWEGVAGESRTDVPSVAVDRPAAPAPIPPGAIARAGGDQDLETLRVQAVIAAERAMRAGHPTAASVLQAHAPAPPAPTRAATAIELPDDDPTPAIIRVLRGDQRARVATVAALAGPDPGQRLTWQSALAAFSEAVIRRAIHLGVLDFPLGNPFWDTFTTGQCRAIAAALSSLGFRFDGIDGWSGERVPHYRDLADAVAAAGLEPRRIRAWPTQAEIEALYREVTVAADDLLVEAAPDLDLEAARAIVQASGIEPRTLESVWPRWDHFRAVAMGPISPD